MFRSWATDVNSNRTTTALAPGATDSSHPAWAIGSGMANTIAIQAQTGNVAASSAAVYAYEYSNNGKSDWHLPSIFELNEMCKYARDTGQPAGRDFVCSGGSSAFNRGFSNFGYWSSTEYTGNTALLQDFMSNSVMANFSKGVTDRVRPVRAF